MIYPFIVIKKRKNLYLQHVKFSRSFKIHYNLKRENSKWTPIVQLFHIFQS